MQVIGPRMVARRSGGIMCEKCQTFYALAEFESVNLCAQCLLRAIAGVSDLATLRKVKPLAVSPPAGRLVAEA